MAARTDNIAQPNFGVGLRPPQRASVEDVSKILWILCSLETFDSLYTGSEWAADDAHALTIAIA